MMGYGSKCRECAGQNLIRPRQVPHKIPSREWCITIIDTNLIASSEAPGRCIAATYGNHDSNRMCPPVITGKVPCCNCVCGAFSETKSGERYISRSQVDVAQKFYADEIVSMEEIAALYLVGP